MRRSLVVVLAALAVASGCGAESQTYTVEETKDAFSRHGYVLEDAHWFGDRPALEEQAILAPRGGASFFVVVTTDAEVDYAWADYERSQDEDSFDARRANVAVIADDGPPRRQRQRVRASLEALSDRGEPVVVAGR